MALTSIVYSPGGRARDLAKLDVVVVVFVSVPENPDGVSAKA
jgi:hypothetical protein